MLWLRNNCAATCCTNSLAVHASLRYTRFASRNAKPRHERGFVSPDPLTCHRGGPLARRACTEPAFVHVSKHKTVIFIRQGAMTSEPSPNPDPNPRRGRVPIASPRPLTLLDFFPRERHWFQVQNNNWFQFWFQFPAMDAGGYSRPHEFRAGTDPLQFVVHSPQEPTSSASLATICTDNPN